MGHVTAFKFHKEKAEEERKTNKKQKQNQRKKHKKTCISEPGYPKQKPNKHNCMYMHLAVITL